MVDLYITTKDSFYYAPYRTQDAADAAAAVTDFTATPVPVVSTDGDGTGATVASITVNSNGDITAVTWDEEGSGYAARDVLTFTQGGVSGDYTLLAANVSSGALQDLSGRTIAGSNDLTAYQGTIDVPDNASPGLFKLSGSSLIDAESDLSDDEKIAIRRPEHRRLLVLQERAFAAIWGASADNDRYQTYQGWLEMEARAGSEDGNITNDTNWGYLLAEASIPGDIWYDLHRVETWATYVKVNAALRSKLGIADDNAVTDANALFWNTSGSMTDFDSRGGTARASVAMNRSTTFNYVHYLRGF